MLSESYVRQTTKLTDLYIRTPLSIEPGLYIMLDTNFREYPECELRLYGVLRSSQLALCTCEGRRQFLGGSKSSMGLPEGSSSRICLPPLPPTISLRNCAPASRRAS